MLLKTNSQFYLTLHANDGLAYISVSFCAAGNVPPFMAVRQEPVPETISAPVLVDKFESRLMVWVFTQKLRRVRGSRGVRGDFRSLPR